jgi:hypothetical protein
MRTKREIKREYVFHWVFPFVIGAVAGGFTAEGFEKDWLIGSMLGAVVTKLLWMHFERPSRVMDINVKLDSRNK